MKTFLRFILELLCVGIIAAIFTAAFELVITKEGTPWWQDCLAWLAVWLACDAYALLPSNKPTP